MNTIYIGSEITVTTAVKLMNDVVAVANTSKKFLNDFLDAVTNEDNYVTNFPVSMTGEAADKALEKGGQFFEAIGKLMQRKKITEDEKKWVNYVCKGVTVKFPEEDDDWEDEDEE